MKRFMLTLIFVFLPHISNAIMITPFSPGYVLNGLHYQGGYGNYTAGSAIEVITALEGSDTRLATRQELFELFYHFGLPINGMSFNTKPFVEFEKYFANTFRTDYWDFMVIHCIYQAEPSTMPGFIPHAIVYADLYSHHPYYTSYPLEKPHLNDRIYTDFWVLPIDYSLSYGMSSWTVTPVPEPSTFALIAVAFLGLGFLRITKGSYFRSSKE